MSKVEPFAIGGISFTGEYDYANNAGISTVRVYGSTSRRRVDLTFEYTAYQQRNEITQAIVREHDENGNVENTFQFLGDGFAQLFLRDLLQNIKGGVQ